MCDHDEVRVDVNALCDLCTVRAPALRVRVGVVGMMILCLGAG